jgi:heterodisulfide reductase subunit A
MSVFKIGAVMVVGAGIGGIQAALDLADLGFKVYVLDKSPAIGGIMAQLDKTFPTNDCSMCILAPKMVEVGRNPNIQLISYAEIEQLEGEAGNFQVTIRKKARYIDEAKCKNCGTCASVCPVRVPDEFNENLTVRTSAHIPFPQAVPAIFLLDPEACLYQRYGICRLCEKACEVNAINFDQKDELITLNVGAIILATGVDTFDPSVLPQYGYNKFQNVITSTEFERILNASGPFGGHVVRPSDRLPPNKVLWILCVGSRNRKLGNNYCSGVCCMYSIKEAVIAKEHDPNIDGYIFYMDIRAVGKGFDEYYQRAKVSGINFVKARIAKIEEDPISQNLIVDYENTESGEILSEEFDLVVLSIGFQPSESTTKLVQNLGIDLNKYNFASTHLFNPLETSKPGVYVCGTLSAPKDIPETVAEASGTAGMVSSLLQSERFSLITEKKYPLEVSVEGQEPRIGAFICHCGINIGAVVNVPEVVEYAKTLPNVVYAEANLYTCSQDSQERIKQIIQDHQLNRVVIASCTPRTHEPLFQNTIREAGLNRYLFELVNIREQCSWVHMFEPEGATEKAKELVAMTVAKAQLFKPVRELSIQIKQSGLVIGGGIAGMTAALELANQGFDVFLIEKEKELGGLVRKIHYTLENEDPQQFLKDLIRKVEATDKVTALVDTNIRDITGYVGNFRVTTERGTTTRELEVGTIVVATGGKEYKPSEYLYGQDERVLTQQDLEGKITAGTIHANSIVMIQCVGSRTEDRPYCSKICCTTAVKNALKLKELDPATEITILHKDIRTYGFKEDYYEKAREAGVRFIRFDQTKPPTVNTQDQELQVSLYDPASQETLAIIPDLLVLSAAFLPAENAELAQMLKVPREQNGFFLEAHVKLRPLDFATEGIFLCGAAQWPKFMNESIAQAKGAAARAAIILSKDSIKVPGVTASVNEERCIGCGACQELCPYNAIEMQYREKRLEKAIIPTYQAYVLEALCKGCGTCASACPVQAITMPHFTNTQIMEMVKTLTKEVKQ